MNSLSAVSLFPVLEAQSSTPSVCHVIRYRMPEVRRATKDMPCSDESENQDGQEYDAEDHRENDLAATAVNCVCHCTLRD